MDRTSAVSDGPLAIISDSHAHTLHQCTALRRLVLLFCERGCEAEARQLSLQILQHFDSAACQNHAEEEEFLFPTLLESMAGSDAVCLREMTSGLTQQHRVLEHMWAGLRTQISTIATAPSATLDVSAVEAFVEANQRHIEREASELLPMASRLFTDNELAYLRHALDGHRPQPAMQVGVR